MMKRIISIICLMLTFVIGQASASEGVWTFKWDTSKSSGGEGFYHITSNDETVQKAILNNLEWTYSGNTSVTAYTGSAGQYFGSAKSPVTHATLSTSYLKGKIKSVSVEAKKKDGTDVTVGVSVNDKSYTCDANVAQQLTTDWTSYTYLPQGSEEEGEIVISLDQTSETTGPIYFLSITIAYDGEGVSAPVKEKVSPELDYALKEMTVEAGDDAMANPLTNPYKVSPITYTIRDASLAVVSSNGNIFTTGKVGTTTVQASFAGNDDYLPQNASYTLRVVAKPVIPAPSVDVPAGSYTEPITVTITSDDEHCKAIWYSITAKDSVELTDEPIIVAGNKAVVVIDNTCTLRCCAVDYNNIGCVTTVDYTVNVPLKADFGAKESRKVYYKMGWDSVEEASTWHYYGISNSTWTLTERCPLSGTEPFTVFDPESKYSLSIYYDNYDQRERAVSPEIIVKENSSVEFYSCFSAIWLYYADWKFKVNDLTDGTSDILVSGFKWSQDNEYTGPNWVYFTFDLAKYAGHKCTFEFIYEGSYGDDMSFDGFKLLQQDNSEDAKINIAQGESVHFEDKSAGHPDYWEWSFEGGTPDSSNEQNPVVTFNAPGEYTVSLTVGKNGESNTCTKQGIVVVTAEAPKAHIGIPEGAYLSPWAMAFVPVNVPVTYKDESTGYPESWKWTFEGTDVKESEEQNPTVTYLAEGQYGLTLDIANSVGSDHDFLVKAIKAGGDLDIWNITPEESSEIAEVSLGWYGSYAGSNWLGMEAFAEHFDAPLTDASIDEVTVYFAETTADDQDAEITVAIRTADEDGMPGNILTSTSLKVSELQYDSKDVVPTVFHFDKPVNIDSEFFVTISGFPTSGYNDNVCVFCAYRGEGKKTTTYHLLADEDADYEPTGTYTWYKNTEEPISLALTPHLTYTTVSTGIDNATVSKHNAAKKVFDLSGRIVANGKEMPKGIYISNGRKTVAK